MPVFDQFKRASFAGLEFPVEEINIDGGIRDHVHEYPHAPGGAPEKLGRKLYTFRMRAKFHSTFRAYGFTELYPRRWNQLRNIFEAERTEDLVVPTLGTLKAYCVSWPETATGRQRSGVSVELTFREDLADNFLVNGLLVTTDARLPQAQAQLQLAREVFEQTVPGQVMLDALPPDTVPGPVVVPNDERTATLSLLDAIDAAINDVLAIFDQAEFQSNLLQTKLDRLLSSCAALDRRVSLKDPRNAPLFEALRDVWAAADERRRDIARKQSDIILYTTPLPRMSVTDVSRAIFGDNSRATEILAFNGLTDPLNIPRGTVLRVYKPQLAA